jgi:hypothetical protein
MATDVASATVVVEIENATAPVLPLVISVCRDPPCNVRFDPKTNLAYLSGDIDIPTCEHRFPWNGVAAFVIGTKGDCPLCMSPKKRIKEAKRAASLVRAIRGTPAPNTSLRTLLAPATITQWQTWGQKVTFVEENAGTQRLAMRLGSGAFGVVWATDDRRYAVKIGAPESIAHEWSMINLLHKRVRFNGAGFLSGYGAPVDFLDRRKNVMRSAMLIERFDGKTARRAKFPAAFVTGASIPVATFWTCVWSLSLLQGVELLGKAGIVHGDIHSGNVMVRAAMDGSDAVRIIDYGMSYSVPEGKFLPAEGLERDRQGALRVVQCLADRLYERTSPHATIPGLSIALLHASTVDQDTSTAYGDPDPVRSNAMDDLNKVLRAARVEAITSCENQGWSQYVKRTA